MRRPKIVTMPTADAGQDAADHRGGAVEAQIESQVRPDHREQGQPEGVEGDQADLEPRLPRPKLLAKGIASTERRAAGCREADVLTGGCEALSFAALGERTGLARNSIYRYFTSRDDVIALRKPEHPHAGWRQADAGTAQ